MDKNNSLVKLPSRAIQRVSRQLTIVDKLMAERDKRLLDWWNGLDDLWQDIFLINLEFASKLKKETITIAEKVICLNIYETYANVFGSKFKKSQEIKVEQLKEISGLKELYCRNTEIGSLEPLRNLTNLSELYCRNTEISSLESLRNLTNLRELYCRNTEISSLEPLRNLTNLSELDCADTEISSLEPLRNLINLSELDCADTEISSLEPLRNLINLQLLYCWDTKISSLEPLRNLTNLSELFFNDISSVEIEKFKKHHPDCNVKIIDKKGAEKPPQQLPSSKNLQGKKILVVDNELGPRESIRIILKNEGAIVQTAEDGYKALEILKNNSFDLITTDLFRPMPDLRGIDFIKEIKARGGSTPIIVISGSGSIGTMNICAELGVFDFVSKPFQTDNLISVINKALKGSSTDKPQEKMNPLR